MQGHERRRLLGKAPLALKLVRYASRGRYRRMATFFRSSVL